MRPNHRSQTLHSSLGCILTVNKICLQLFCEFPENGRLARGKGVRPCLKVIRAQVLGML